MYPFPALVTPFPRTFITKGNANNGRNPPPCPLPAIATPFCPFPPLVTPVKVFIKEEATGYINKEVTGDTNEATIGAIIAGRSPPSCFFISCLLLHQHYQFSQRNSKIY